MIVLPRARTKYAAVRTQVDGIWFASKKEATRYATLKLLEKAGAIRGLQLQVRFPLVVNGVKVTTYVCDFAYDEGDQHIVEDTKGVRTPAYKVKAKLMFALHGVVVRET